MTEALKESLRKYHISRRKRQDFVYRRMRESGEYKQYLLSEHWLDTKRKAIQRAACLCEWCHEKRPLQVHHLTYANIGHEFDEDLIALCQKCHTRIHAERLSFTSKIDFHARKPKILPQRLGKYKRPPMSPEALVRFEYYRRRGHA
jgi:hypothetical protein